MSPPLNIVLFGETGVGKSSVVNLIAGQEVAEISSDAPGCTMSFERYTVNVSGRTFNIWDTVGLNEPRMGGSSGLVAVEQACKLIHQLAKEGGVDLLLFCIRGSRVNGTTRNNYKLFHKGLCGSEVPIALVITNLEWEADMEDWWGRNQSELENLGIEATAGYACVTGVPDEPRKYEESKEKINRLLEKQDGGKRATLTRDKQWYSDFLRQIVPSKVLKRKDAVNALVKYGKLDQRMAEEVAAKLEEEDRISLGRKTSSLNIVLFGETGVGKSSVINLIAGAEIAVTSPDAVCCTMSFEPYTFNVDGQDFHVWDTAGLEDPVLVTNAYLRAIEQAWELIQNLASKGGVDLLLFCIRGNRVTATTQSNYRLFYEVLCKSKVPIALVITHLEKEAKMEDWWDRNQESLQSYGIKSAGHACVTALPRHLKYEESRTNINILLEGQDRGQKFIMPPDKWYIEFLRLFGLFVPLKMESKKRDIVKALMKRCNLDQTIAEELAGKLTETNAAT